MRSLGAALLAFSLFPPTLSARAVEPLKPIRTDTPPVINGIMDDEVWVNAPFVTGFKTWQPESHF